MPACATSHISSLPCKIRSAGTPLAGASSAAVRAHRWLHAPVGNAPASHKLTWKSFGSVSRAANLMQLAPCGSPRTTCLICFLRAPFGTACLGLPLLSPARQLACPWALAGVGGLGLVPRCCVRLLRWWVESAKQSSHKHDSPSHKTSQVSACRVRKLLTLAQKRQPRHKIHSWVQAPVTMVYISCKRWSWQAC